MKATISALCALCYAGMNIACAQQNWADLESILGNGSEKLFDRERLLSSLENANVNIRTNSKVLTEMAIQSRYPFVAMAGLWGLRELDPDLAYRVSFEKLWISTNAGSWFGLPFLACITNSVEPRLFRSAFSAVTLAEPKQTGTAFVVIEQIPINNLLDWLMSPEGKNSSVTIEAVVVDRLMSAKDQLSVKELAEIRRRLKELKDCPGVPLAIYLLHSDVESNSLVEMVKAVIEDLNVDRSPLKQMLFRRFAKKLAGKLDIGALKVPDADKKRYGNWLEKYLKE